MRNNLNAPKQENDHIPRVSSTSWEYFAIVKNSMFEKFIILYHKHCILSEKAASNIYRGYDSSHLLTYI